MPLPLSPNCVQIAIQYGTTGWQCTNVINVETAEDDHQVIAAGFADSWYLADSLAELQSTSVFLNQITVTKWDGMTGGIVFTPGDIGHSGSAGGTSAAPVSPQVAGVVTWRTGLAGRSYRGRTYVGGLAQTAVDEAEGTIEGAAAGTWAAASEIFRSEVASTINAEIVVMSLIEDGVEREAPFVSYVTSSVPRLAMRTQRRRASRVAY